MSLFVTSIASGSNGNCYYIGNNTEAILVDAGISCREIEKRMKRLGLSMQKVKAVFVSHEHGDHIKGISVLTKKYQMPVYITMATVNFGRLHIDKQHLIPFKPYAPVAIGGLNVTAFPKLHDAADPYSFTVECKKIKVGVFTDIGTPCENLIRYFKECHAAFLESNYDTQMLEEGNYPYHLKNRIRGGKGHLSNTQALELFKAHKSSFMSHLFLSHLSKNNNCPNLVKELFTAHAGDTKIIVATRIEETPLYAINHVSTAGSGLSHITVTSSQLQFSFT